MKIIKLIIISLWVALVAAGATEKIINVEKNNIDKKEFHYAK
jgi:hypothetical protein|tara:strand:- start:204 stop:329 length:126 start_codon:yes stop_codon:yes gene_type:complete